MRDEQNPRDAEREQLLASHANRELLARDEHRLRSLAGSDSGMSALVNDLDELHRAFDAERTLRAKVAAPSEPVEEADLVYERLQRAAAKAEGLLRAQLSGTPTASVVSLVASKHRTLAWSLAAAAAALVVVFLVLRHTPAPGMLGETPKDQVAGPRAIQLNPVLSAASPNVTWQAVPGARRYDVEVVGEDAKVVLERPQDAARSTRWDLSLEEMQLLRARTDALYLHVVARSAIGTALATSNDVQLTVR